MDARAVENMNLPADFLYEVRRLTQCLKNWSLTPGEKLYDPEDILRLNLMEGDKFLTRLKDEWEYGIRRSHRIPVCGRDYMEWEPVRNYNALPPVQFMINWEIIPEDYKYMQIPLGEFSLLDEFIETFESFLPETIEMPDEVDILTIVKTSTSFDLRSRKRIPFFEARKSHEGSRFSRSFKALRTIIPVGAGNVRDSVVTTIDTFNSVKMVDLITLRLLDSYETSLVNESPSVFNKRLKSASKKISKEAYYLRDIKKCGLTFPRELFHAIQDSLTEKYPDKDFSYFNIFRDFSVYDENMKPLPNLHRGFGLGMANNLVTLCQCVMFEMLKYRMPPSINLKGCFGNDDSIVAASCDDEASLYNSFELIESEDDEICAALNVMKHPDKSFWSIWPIIFEEYGHDDFKDKDSRLACALASCNLAPNIKYAKCLTNALSPLYKGKEYEQKILSDLIDQWGFEYYPQESDYDYSLGGWYTHLEDGCKTALREVENVQDDNLIVPMYRAKLSVDAFNKSMTKIPERIDSEGKSFTPIGNKFSIWVKDSDFKTVNLPKSQVMMTDKECSQFYKSLFEMSRNVHKSIESSMRRFKRPVVEAGSVSKRDLVTFMLKSGDTFAIPKQHVLSESSCTTRDYTKQIYPPPVLKRSLAQRELLILESENKIRIDGDNINRDLPKSLVGSDIADIPKGVDHFKVYVSNTEDKPYDKTLFQYSTNVYIPLMEYNHRYGTVPIQCTNLVDRSDRIKPHELIDINPKTFQQLRFALFLMEQNWSTLEIIDYLSTYSDKDKLKDEDIGEVVPEDTFTCDAHSEYAGAGWSQDWVTYAPVVDGCDACDLYKLLYRANILSQHAETPEDRAIYLLELPKYRNALMDIFIRLKCNYGNIPVLFDSTESKDIFGSDADSDGNSSEGGGIFGDMF
jgi:hypothetical protein